MLIEEIVNDVVSVFETMDLTPVRGIYCDKIDKQDCACAIGALAYKQDSDWDYIKLATISIENRFRSKYGLHFVDGLIDGFDGLSFDENDSIQNKPDYVSGYETGRECWNRVKHRVVS